MPPSAERSYVGVTSRHVSPRLCVFKDKTKVLGIGVDLVGQVLGGRAYVHVSLSLSGYRSVREGGDDVRRQEAEEEANVDEEGDVEPDVERGARVQPARPRAVDRRSRPVAVRRQRGAGRAQRRRSRRQRAARSTDDRRPGDRRRAGSLAGTAGRSQRTCSLASVARRDVRLRMTRPRPYVG